MPVLALPSFAKGEVSPNVHGRVDTNMYKVALRTARNAIIHNYGGVSNRPGTLCVVPVKNHDPDFIPRIFRFHQGTSDQYVLEFGDLYMRAVRNDAYVMNADVTITDATQADPVVVTAPSHGYANGTHVVITMEAGMVEINGRVLVVRNQTTNTFEIEDQITGVAIDGTGYAAYTSGGTVADIFELVTPYVQADLPFLKMVQTGNTITITYTGYAPRDLTRTAHNVWTLAVNTYAPTLAAPTNGSIIMSFDRNFQIFTRGGLTVNYRITSISDTDGSFEESLPLTITGTNSSDPPLNTLSWTAEAGATRYAVYRRDNGLYGLLGETELTSFEDKNLATDLTISPPSARNPFTTLYPMASGYYQQRQAYGGTTAELDKTWYSQTGLRLNMSVSAPLQEADAITASLSSQDVQEIRHYVPVGKDLLIFTNAGEWRVNSGSGSGFSPNTITQDPETNWGSAHMPPIVIGKTVLFVEDGAARIRALGFKLAIDGLDTNDLTTLANHLLADKSDDQYVVKDWAFAQFPEPRIYIIRSDGKALTLTFDAEQEVIAWTHWDTQGLYHYTTTLRRSLSGVEDGVYFVISRKTALGGNATFIERLHSRKFADARDVFFLDLGHELNNVFQITDITDTDPAVFTTSAPHGFSNGDEIELRDIEWADEDADQFNDFHFELGNVGTPTTFELLSHVTVGGGEGWDLSTVQFDTDFDTGVLPSGIGGFDINADGTKAYIAFNSTPQIVYQYSFGVAYDIATLTYDSVSLDVSALDTWGISGIEFGNSGFNLYVNFGISHTMRMYSLSSAYDLSTAVYSGRSRTTFHESMTFNATGTKLYTADDRSPGIVEEYTLGTAWEIDSSVDTVTLTSSLNIGAERIADIFLKPDGLKLYILGDSSNVVLQYDLTVADDLSTATDSGLSFLESPIPTRTRDLVFKSDGSVMYITGRDAVAQEYSLDTPASSEDVGLPSTEVYKRGGEVRECVTSISNLWCLEGLEVTLFFDGNLEESQTVVNGKITVADGRCITRAAIGLGYTCDIELLNVEAGTAPSTLQGQLKKIAATTVRFHKSRMPQVGPRADYLTQMRPREFEKLGQASALISGDARVNLPPDWNSNGRIFFRQSDPVPLTLLAVFPSLATEDNLE